MDRVSKGALGWRIARMAGFSATAFFLVIAFSVGAQASKLVPQTPLPGSTIEKYKEPLPTFGPGAGSIPRVKSRQIQVSMEEFRQKVLPASIYSTLVPPYDAGTLVWGYRVAGLHQDCSGGAHYGNGVAHYPGVTIEAARDKPTTVKYVNNIPYPSELQKYLTVDQNIHWADPLNVQCMMNPMAPDCATGVNGVPYSGPVPNVVHLHGAEVSSDFDGGPEQWFTSTGLQGKSYRTYLPTDDNSAIYRYPNSQEPTTLWFHDHALGTTRLNVYGGLAAFYLLRDKATMDKGTFVKKGLPSRAKEIEIVIQDRQFDTNGQWLFPDGYPAGLNGPPTNPDVHPFWIPEFFGDVIVVNGKSWPYLSVEPRRYRLRFLNGSNARFYSMWLQQGVTNPPASANTAPIWQIGTDGGLLDSPVKIAIPDKLLLAPGERADVIVDFAAYAGMTLTLRNDAPAPFPAGAPPDPATTAQIMQFTVAANAHGNKDQTYDPANPQKSLRSPMVRTTGIEPDQKRQLVLREVLGPGGPLEVLLNNTKWSGLQESTLMTPDPVPVSGSQLIGGNWVTELPYVGSTEEWEIINLTGDAHPIHLHLVQFQLLDRQAFDLAGYTNAWITAFGTNAVGGVAPAGDGPPNPYTQPNEDSAVGGNPAVSPFLIGPTLQPNQNEMGWKDTVVMLPNQVTRIAVRWTPQDVAASEKTLGQNLYPFDPTEGPGYVWHCHILDHEDNEMMRPYIPIGLPDPVN